LRAYTALAGSPLSGVGGGVQVCGD
jgi:hypothetical protein